MKVNIQTQLVRQAFAQAMDRVENTMSVSDEPVKLKSVHIAVRKNKDEFRAYAYASLSVMVCESVGSNDVLTPEQENGKCRPSWNQLTQDEKYNELNQKVDL